MKIIFSCISFFIFQVSLWSQVSDSISYNLQEVEVSASSKPSTSRSSTPLQVMTEKEFKMQGIQSVGDAIKRFSGVVLKDYGGIGGLKTVSLRGMGAEYTAVSYDGVMVNNMQSGQVDIGRFSLENLSMISLVIGQEDDIFRTAKSFASSGVLNLQVKKPEFSNKDYSLRTKISTGSFGLFEPVITYNQKLSNKTSLSTNIGWQRADGKYPYTLKEDLMMPDRKRRNSDVSILRTEINLYNQLSKKDNLDLKLYYYDSERGLPGKTLLYIDENNDRLWDKNFFGQIGYSRLLNNRWNFKSVAKYEHTYQKYQSDYFVNGATTPAFNIFKENEVYWSNMLQYKFAPRWSMSLAQDLTFSNLKSSFMSYTDARSEPSRYSSLTSLAVQYKSERLSVTASGLNTFTKEKITNKGEKEIYRKLSPNISTSFKPLGDVDWRLRASYRHIYRIPTFNEMYYVNMARELKPESSSQYNIGTTWVGSIINSPISYINVSVDGYYNDVRNKIIIFPAPYNPYVENKKTVKMKGVDLKLAGTIRIMEDISLDLNAVYSFMRAYDDDKNNKQSYKGQLPYIPKHSGSASLSINNPWVKLTYAMLASGTRYTSAENLEDNKMKSYTDHSLTAFKELTFKGYKLYATASILNLLNENYSIIRYYPMPGRSFRVSLGLDF